MTVRLDRALAARTRRHHNNRGAQTVRSGKCAAQVKRIAARLGLRFAR